MQLTKFPKVRYTLLELELFAAMPQNGDPINTKELVYARLKKGPWDILHPRNVISTTMSKLMLKIERNKEAFRIIQTRKSGHGREIEYRLNPHMPVFRSRSASAKDIRSSLFD